MLNRKKSGLNAGKTDTLIGEDTLIEGNIQSRAGLRIEGRIMGDIECAGDVVIGEKGVTHSNVVARNVVNAGTINGSIHAKEMLTITETGKVYGSINVASVIIAKGGLFQGTSRMENKPAESERKKQEDGKPALSKVEKISSAK